MNEDERARLEQERDFLLRSLDDLEREREKGAIDDESYARLHDDYTARAAVTIRALRDDTEPEPAPAPGPARTPASTRRRVLALVVVVVFVAVAVVGVAFAVTERGEGGTATGNTGAQSDDRATLKERQKRLEAAVAADPDDIASRLLLARYLEAGGDLAGALVQYDEVLVRTSQSAEAAAQGGRILYLTAQAAVQSNPDAVDGLVQQSLARLDRAVEIDPEYADARYFRAIVVANEFGDFTRAQGDLQRYLILRPQGQFADAARELLAQVTSAIEGRATSTTTAP